ncbi:MAG: hypothetical protein D6738_12330 [Acidobacteria bacterium]|nr:MAG: hypothetical protein D6738_12330 [Acidobacteriota bacterium]
MNTAFIVFQLGFNIIVLTALIVLAWRGPRRAPARAVRTMRRPGAPKTKTAPPAPAPPSPDRPADLGALVERANRDELAAEAALRERLARFRARQAAS